MAFLNSAPSSSEEIDSRLEVAMCLRSLIKKKLFDETTAATEVVTGRVREFLLLELRTLLGLQAPAQGSLQGVTAPAGAVVRAATTPPTSAPTEVVAPAALATDSVPDEVIHVYRTPEGQAYAQKVRNGGVVYRELLDESGVVVSRTPIPVPVPSRKGYPTPTADQMASITHAQAVASVESGANVAAAGSEAKLPLGRLVGNFVG